MLGTGLLIIWICWTILLIVIGIKMRHVPLGKVIHVTKPRVYIAEIYAKAKGTDKT